MERIPDNLDDQEVLAKAAKTLELAYRKHLTENWPNMEGSRILC